MRQFNPNTRNHRDEASISAGLALYFRGQIRGVLLT